MKNNASNVIIKVDDIDICRSFYRNILNLGAPVVNSNFQVEFLTCNRGRVILQKKGEEDEHDKEPGTRTIHCEEAISNICHRLGAAGHCYEYIDKDQSDCCRLRDPAGNLLTIIGQKVKGKVKRFDSGATVKISTKSRSMHKTNRLS